MKFSWKDPKPVKTCAVVRYGIIGDLIVMSHILPRLKEQGFHITLYTTPTGHETMKHDPHIDKFIVQEASHIPNVELRDFFNSIEPKYDKFVNLCESVEATLLALPQNINATFSKSARHLVMDRNYLEMTSAMAEVPFSPDTKFFMTPEEEKWAKETRKSFNADYIVCWPLHGSAINKIWPHHEDVFKRLLDFPGVKIVTMGDGSAQLLESGWEDEYRIIRKCGRWSIRESLSFLSQADLVIGPETGLMNVVSMMSMPKIVILSHSSIENLTKHWVNTISLTAKTSCYPCHILHKNYDLCTPKFIPELKEPIGATCMFDISPDQVWGAIIQHLKVRRAA